MIKTRQKTRKQISNLSLDIEIVNPIESKSLFGGCSYGGCGNSYGGWNCGNTIYISQTQWSSTGPTGSASNSGYGGAAGGGDSGGGSSTGGDSWIDNNYDGINDVDQNNQEEKYDKHICTQLNQGTTCATMALSYVANHFGGTGLTSSDFAEMAGKNYMSMMVGLEEGLTSFQLATIMSNVFQSTQISTYQEIASNANNGIPVLATIDQGSGIGHEVVITNLNLATGVMTFMDSLTGGAVTSNLIANPITFTGSMYAVSGIQNNNIVNQYRNDTNDVKCGICGH